MYRIQRMTRKKAVRYRVEVGPPISAFPNTARLRLRMSRVTARTAAIEYMSTLKPRGPAGTRNSVSYQNINIDSLSQQNTEIGYLINNGRTKLRSEELCYVVCINCILSTKSFLSLQILIPDWVLGNLRVEIIPPYSSSSSQQLSASNSFLHCFS